MIAALAVVVSAWVLQDAGRRAIRMAGGCALPDLQIVPLALARTPMAVGAVLGTEGDPHRAACIRTGMQAQLLADGLFLGSYGALNLAIFLFLTAEGRAFPACMRALAVGLGGLLTVAMVAGDIVENRYAGELIRLISTEGAGVASGRTNEVLGHLYTATCVKWGALALAALTAAILYLRSPLWLLLRGALALVGGAVAGLFIWACIAALPQCIAQGAGLLSVFWLATLVYAIGVATIDSPPSTALTTEEA
jgi:hypothetical protein